MKNTGLILIGGVLGAIFILFCLCGSVSALFMLPAPEPTRVIVQPTPVRTQMHELRVVNQTDSTICYLYVSPDWSSSWGDDQLGTDVIRPGDSFVLYNIRSGYYDLKAVTCAGATAYEYEFAIYSDSRWAVYN